MKKIFKGFIIGITNVIPGVCSALVAMSLNVYQNLLEITSFPLRKKTWKNNYLYIIGISIGIIFSILVLNLSFKKWPFLVLSFFLGITMYGIVPLHKRIKKYSILIVFEIVLGVLLVLLSNFLNVSSVVNNKYYLFIIGGILSAIAFIAPGVSGSMMLLILGIYFPLLSLISDGINCLVTLSILPLDDLLKLFFFGISFLLALVIASRIIENIMKKWEIHFISVCLGMVYGTIIVLILKMIPLFTITNLILGLILLISGFFIVFKLGSE